MVITTNRPAKNTVDLGKQADDQHFSGRLGKRTHTGTEDMSGDLK